MIKEKEFKSLTKLNEFKDNNPDMHIINVESVIIHENTRLPLPHGENFISKTHGYKLYYNED